MTARTCKRLEYAQIRRTFQVQNPSVLFGLIILLKADFLESLGNLTPPIVDSMGFADKSDHDIAIGSLVQHDFGMAGGDDLRLLWRWLLL